MTDDCMALTLMPSAASRPGRQARCLLPVRKVTSETAVRLHLELRLFLEQLRDLLP